MPASFERSLKVSAGLLGSIAMVTQILVVREVMAQFGGNELTIGLVLGCWMLLTATGAWLGRWLPERQVSESLLAGLVLFAAFLALITVISLQWSRVLIFPIGVMVSPVALFFLVLVTLVPFCVLSGFIFPLLSELFYVRYHTDRTALVYALDSLGSIAGGLTFNLVLLFLFGTYQVLAIMLALASCLSAFLLFQSGWKKTAYFITGMGVAWLLIFLVFDPGKYANEFYFKDQQLLKVINTPYGRLAFTELDKQVNVYMNGSPVLSGNDPITREESVHYAMALDDHPENVLLVSGGLGGTFNEVLKYNVSRFDYVEVDPWIIRESEKLGLMGQTAGIGFFFRDARRFLRNIPVKYDVVLVNVPEPSSAELNRFYSVEFFRLARSKMTPDGILSISLPSGGDYMNEELLRLHSATVNTLLKVFSHVRIIPASRNYLLASDRDLNASVMASLEEKGIVNQYVNPYYVDERLMDARAKQIMENLDPQAGINTDLRPVAYELFLEFWMSHFGVKTGIIPLVLIALLVLFFIFYRPLSLGMFTAGFTGVSMEFIFLLWFQVVNGFLYWMAGVLFSVFMAGLALGTWQRDRIISHPVLRSFLKGQFWLMIMSALFALSILGFHALGEMPAINTAFVVLVTFITGSMVGIQFSTGIAVKRTGVLKGSSDLYSADLIGSAIGIILVSLYLVPEFGLVGTGLITAGLNMLCLIIILLKGKKDVSL